MPDITQQSEVPKPVASPSWRRVLKLLTWWCVDSLVLLTPRGSDSGAVLVVRLDNIGDFVLWLDAAKQLTRHYRAIGRRVVLAAPSAWAEWARDLALFDEVVTVNKDKAGLNLAFRFRLHRSIRRLGCSTALVPTYSRSWVLGDCILRICGAAERIGSVGDPVSGTQLERRWSNPWYTKLLPATPLQLMELARNAEFVSELLQAQIPPRIADLRSENAEARSADLQRERGIEEPFYVLFPGASAAGKKWPLLAFQEIARRIYRETGWLGVVCGGKEDASLGEELCRSSDVPLNNQAGTTTLAQLAALILGAQLVVSNDTAAVHIAAAVHVPSVCILGGGHVGRFLPYDVEESYAPLVAVHPMPCFGCHWHCIYKVPPADPKPCVANVGIEDVWRCVASLLPVGGAAATLPGDLLQGHRETGAMQR